MDSLFLVSTGRAFCSEEVCICKKSLISSQVGVFAGVEKSQPSTLHFTGAGAMVVRFVFH